VEGFFRQKKGRGGFEENPLSSSSCRQNRGREEADEGVGTPVLRGEAAAGK